MVPKSGVALQFTYDWGHSGEKVYCSIDLIPIFPIEAIPTMELNRSIEENMLAVDAPPGWLHFMFKYPRDYKIILQGPNSIETFWLEFWLEKPLDIPF